MGMGFVQVAITLIIIMLLVKPVGSYLVKVFDYEKTGLDRVFGPFERITYRMMGVREGEAMGWKKYLGADASDQLHYVDPSVSRSAAAKVFAAQSGRDRQYAGSSGF